MSSDEVPLADRCDAEGAGRGARLACVVVFTDEGLGVGEAWRPVVRPGWWYEA